jgi:hypothetical protein
MTDERDFDRLARAWLELSPDRAPERSVVAILQAVETTPQVRTWPRWLPWRDTTMTRLSTVMAVVAVAVLAVGGLFLINRPNEGSVGAPSASPTDPSTQEPVADVVPADLLGRWMSRGQSVTGVAPGEIGLTILFEEHSADLAPSNQWATPLIQSVASGAADGTLRLSGSPMCPAGAVGDYAWALSESGRRLTITAGSDACVERANALSGDWDLMGCKLPDDGCLGDLDPGTYATQYVSPRLNAIDAWAPKYAALTYATPAGWANSMDWPNEFALTPTADFALETKDGPPADTFHGIYLLTRPVPAAQTADCSDAEEPDVGDNVEELLDWVRGRPGVIVGDSGTITVGPYEGTWVDLSVDPSWDFTCSNPDDRSKIALLSVAGPDDNAWWLMGNERLRVILLDIGEGNVVAIGIDSTYPERFDELVAEAMPIVESFRFK